MESIYLGIVLFLFLLAIFDLVVGVSNDAVNFLGSAVGARAASFKWIMGVAAVGILCGAVMSNGMMDVARHGIFRPEQFYFQDIMCICLAVMAIDVILLDTFNTLGLPTSTTVSIVFELLGGAFALAMVKLAADDTGLTFADMLNSEKALSVIMAIFLSVAIAFVFGAVVQYIARLIFTFNYKSHRKWSAALFGGVAMTAIIYFILIKGMKDSSFMTPELSEWISTYTRHLVAGCFVFFCILSQVLYWCRVNIFKVVTLLGTFALALAFAGNDLVNFVGVPLTGYSSYMDYVANGNGSETFLMDSLNAPARTPFIFLALSGVVMIVALTTSRKARGVIKTSVDLARQDAGDEMFGSSGLARSIVRASSSLAMGIENVMPQGLKRWLGKRFDKDEAILENGAAFDMVRAAVNLLLASLLIALGTSLKLPLSTTYVAFMVAMGSSLADRAWGRESAVFRITGVISVIGGWFITAGAAFVATFLLALAIYYGGTIAMVVVVALTILFLIRSNIRYRRKMKAEHDDVFKGMMTSRDKAEVWTLLRRHMTESLMASVTFAESTFRQITDGLLKEDIKSLRKAERALGGEKDLLKRVRRRQMLAMRRIDRNLALEKNTWFHTASNASEQLYYCLKRLCEPCKEHVGNNFNPMPKVYLREFLPIRTRIFNLMVEIRRMMEQNDYSDIENVLIEAEGLRESISTERKTQMYRVQEEGNSLHVSLVYLITLQESQELVDTLRQLLKACNKFTK